VNSFSEHNLINWVKTVLPDDITDIQEIAATAYSYVVKITTCTGVYYLKQTPAKLYIEAGVLDILNIECGLKNVPEIIAKNDELHCFLMPACGEQTLRTLFGDTFYKELCYKGVASYVDLQKASTPHFQKFIDIGVPDRRIGNLPNAYADFVNDDERMALWALTPEEEQRCQRSQRLFLKLCEELSALGLPDVLNHSDFHPNAMLLDQHSGDIKIIDLGEVTIGNPLFPLASCLTNYLEHRHKIRADKDEYDSIKMAFLKLWGLSGADVMALVDVVGPLQYAMSFRELMKLSDHNCPKWKSWIKLAFFDYLDNLERRYMP
jgi:hypothetical protein